VDNEGAGLLPICADLADVTSTTAWYIRLQRIYAKKVRQRSHFVFLACVSVAAW